MASFSLLGEDAIAGLLDLEVEAGEAAERGAEAEAVG